MHRANGFTRHEILNAIKQNGSLTTEELGQQMEISAVAVRQHLSALESDGLISTTVERRGLGRPVHRYSITPKGDETFPRIYDAYAACLLAELREALGEQAVQDLITAQRHRFMGMVQGRIDGKTLAEAVVELARIQSEYGFMAKAEEEDGGYRLTEHNCSICRVADSHREVCQSEILFFSELLGNKAKVERDRYILAGDHVCSYRITPLPTGG